MPRGGGRRDGNNTPIMTAGRDLSSAELKNLTQAALAVFLRSDNPPDLHNPDETRAAVIGYFNTCIERGLRPGNLGLYAALGLSRQDYNNIVTGKSKSRATPECIDILKNATRAIGSYRESLALEGKILPATYIFMGKNFDQLEDNTRIEVSADTGNAARLTPEQVAKQIERDIPVDVDFSETE